MNNQQAFDAALNGIRKQGYQKSLSFSGCCYRNPEGLKCAIGHAIPDELYTSALDSSSGGSVCTVLKNFPEISELFKGCDPNLLEALQNAHDQGLTSPASWEERMERIAFNYNLAYTAP